MALSVHLEQRKKDGELLLMHFMRKTIAKKSAMVAISCKYLANSDNDKKSMSEKMTYMAAMCCKMFVFLQSKVAL
jgi:hypothetical protein